MTWTDRFDAFVTRKQAAALAARLSGYHTVDSRRHRVALEQAGNEWTLTLFDGPFFASEPTDLSLPAISTVFVQSADGNTGARNPQDLGGGATDTHLIYEGLSRVHADAVLTGGTTIQGSQIVFGVWHPELVELRASAGLPRYPAQIVATRKAQLGIESELIFNVPSIPVFILTTPDGAHALAPRLSTRPWITIVAAPEREHLVGSLRRLRAEHGVGRISCIGGRTLATELLDAGVVQDLYLTTAPRAGGEPGTPFYAGTGPLATTLVVKKAGRGDEAGVVFEHLVMTSSDRPT
jgi:riboflavin biosynthesis pyrimidine reductase